MSMHVMLDVETAGLDHFAPILSIGAVKFDPNINSTAAILDEFEVHVDLKDCQRLGLRLDAGTFIWWLGADETARKGILVGQSTAHDLPTALGAFRDWFGEAQMPVWGNGAAFDNVLLTNAYKLIGEEAPWSYKQDRCFRTVKNLAPEIECPDTGRVVHSALGDAYTQARWLQEIASHLSLEL